MRSRWWAAPCAASPYDLNEDGKFNVEYADVLGIPFDFTARPVVVGPGKTRQTVQVRAMRPERDHLEITFPRVAGYREDPPKEDLVANFTDDSRFDLTPELVGPTQTRNEGIIGEGVDLNLVHTGDLRTPTLAYHLTKRLLETKWRDPNEDLKLHLFGRLRSVVNRVAGHLPGLPGRDVPGAADVPVAGRHGLQPASPPPSPAATASAPSRRCWTPSTPPAPRATSTSPPGGPACGPPTPASATSTWPCWTATGRPNSAGWRSRSRRSKPTSRTTTLAWKSPTSTAQPRAVTSPDFILLVDDGHEDPLNLIVEIKRLPARGRQGKEERDGSLLAARRQRPGRPRPLGLRRANRRVQY